MRLVLKVLKSYLPDSARLVDLGAGTGNLSRRIFESLPDCTSPW